MTNKKLFCRLMIGTMIFLLSFLSCEKEPSYYAILSPKHQEVEVTVISKTPCGAYDINNDPNKFYGMGWYMIGLSRNGEEPPEYIWRANRDAAGYIIIGTDIGTRGFISLHPWWAEDEEMKLPCPNADDPPIIGAFGEIRWEKID